MSDEIIKVLNDMLGVDPLEEEFSCFLKYSASSELSKIIVWQENLSTLLKGMSSEQKEVAVRQYLVIAFDASYANLQLLTDLLKRLVSGGALQARLVGEAIISNERLSCDRQDFWVESFKLLYTIIDSVEYKGVLKIMKGCYEKAKTFPKQVHVNLLPQMQALLQVLEHILDRNACLIPGYLVVNELLKEYPKFWPHWQLAKLFSDYIESFRACAQMVSVIGQTKMRPVVERGEQPEALGMNPWKLNQVTLRFELKGKLPYAPEVLEKQTGLVQYVLQQPHSHNMVCRVLGLQKHLKQHCPVLEEQIVELIVLAMEKSEAEADESTVKALWSHLSSQLICFVSLQFASFPNIILALHRKLNNRELRRGRDHLMWMLLEVISGFIQRNPLPNFLPVLALYELLFPERELALYVPNFNQPMCVQQMAMICIWNHLVKKGLILPLPDKLRVHHECLQYLIPPSSIALSMANNFNVSILCNAYSTNPDYFSKPLTVLIEAIQGSGNSAELPTVPLSMVVLDSLTVHSKVSLIHSIVTYVIKLAQTKPNAVLAPALVETYGRLLVCTEIESLSINSSINQLLPTVYKSHALTSFYTLLEMFNYRMQHIHPHYRIRLFSHIHSLVGISQNNQSQFHLCSESTALHLITSLSSREIQPQLYCFLGEPQTLVSTVSEQLNRALVLTLASSINFTGGDITWCHKLLTAIAQNTPHTWATHTLKRFPPQLAEFFRQHPVPKENKQQLEEAVEEEYRKWCSMKEDTDLLTHFGVASGPPLFLCLLWKLILKNHRINNIAFRILQCIGPRTLSAHLKKFCDYLVHEFTNSPDGLHVNKYISILNDIIWKYNVVTIDKLVLCLAFSTQEDRDAQVSAFIIQQLLLKDEFRNRVQHFVKENVVDHWNHDDWHCKQFNFHKKYPETFSAEEQDNTYYPYFGNACLRFLPVFDIVIHRFLEIPQITKNLEILLEHFGCLYKFHDRPITYLYKTLYYYDGHLSEKPSLKRRLVAAILGDLRNNLSERYQLHIKFPEEIWDPELSYYTQLIKALVDILAGISTNTSTDWRFNEFPNAGAQALYITCVEIMSLYPHAKFVASGLLDVVIHDYTKIPSDDMHQWINAIGLVLAALPMSYWSILLDRLLETISELEQWPFDCSPLRLFNFQETHFGLLHNRFSYLLALAHSVWHHSSPGQIENIPRWIRKRLTTVVQCEPQFLFVCHLVGPFLQRFDMAIAELTGALYQILAQVDHAQPQMNFMDPICDFLYHIKYMFIGNSMKTELESVVRSLRPALQSRLRFIANISKKDVSGD